MSEKNIVLIGMPSSGKSTTGKHLAAVTSMSFVDSDTIIKTKQGRELRDIVNTEGLPAFLKIQEDAVLGLNVTNHVIATGGSVVYSEASMKHLSEKGIIVFLKLPYEEITDRITSDRRFARNQGQSFLDIYNERIPLYIKYADISIDCSEKTVETIAEEILKEISEETILLKK